MADFDLFVIGGGSGGVACARRAGAYGARVALCEPSRIGGTCVIRGCIPKKLMRYGAAFADHFEASRAYGWRMGSPEHDWRALIEARDAEIARLNGVYIRMLDNAGVTRFDSRGRIVGPNAVEVNGATQTAERIVVAVGARPSLPPLPGLDLAITSDDALENMAERPDRLIVVGGGYIGIELATICHALGIATTLVIRRTEPLRGFDLDVRAAATEEMKRRGLDIRSSTTVDRLERAGGRLVLHTTAGPIPADAVLYATGRDPIPNTRGLGLEELGVRMNASGAVCVDPAYRSNLPSVYAVGDCSDHAGAGLDSGSFDLTPVAIAEGRVIAETLFNHNPHVVNYDTIPTAVFGLPEIGMVGLTEERARALGHDVATYRTSFRPLLHTLTDAPVKVMMKLVVDRASDRVLGCHMVGEEAGEIIQGLAIAMTAGATKAQFDETVGLHPSAAEEFVTMYQASA
ncbi:MAG TPA: glutathione-disulfide reductase [Geminicoccaceae bacterium]|nr:glutathione-disulfide reductase [Geminicoccaceae bacterium]